MLFFFSFLDDRLANLPDWSGLIFVFGTKSLLFGGLVGFCFFACFFSPSSFLLPSFFRTLS